MNDISNGLSILGGLSWSEFYLKYKMYIIIGSIVLIGVIGLTIWWWKKRSSSNEHFSQHHDHAHPSPKQKQNHDHAHPSPKQNHDHDHGHQGKRIINEENFNSGKKKMKGTLELMDKVIIDLKKIIDSIKKTKTLPEEEAKDEQEELTERLEFTLNFLKKMNEQAKKFGSFLIEDAHELKQYSSEFQSSVDQDIQNAQQKFEQGVLLVQDFTTEMSTPSSEDPSKDPSSNDDETSLKKEDH